MLDLAGTIFRTQYFITTQEQYNSSAQNAHIFSAMLFPRQNHNSNNTPTAVATWRVAPEAIPPSCASSQSGARRAAATGGRAQGRQARRGRGRSVGAALERDSCCPAASRRRQLRLIGIVASPRASLRASRHAAPSPGPTVDPKGFPMRGRSVVAALARDSRPFPQPAGKDEFHCRGLGDLARTSA